MQLHVFCTLCVWGFVNTTHMYCTVQCKSVQLHHMCMWPKLYIHFFNTGLQFYVLIYIESSVIVQINTLNYLSCTDPELQPVL